MAELPKDIWKGVRKERERRAGVDDGEIGKSWDDAFAPEKAASSADLGHDKFFKKDPKRGGPPPAELLKKHYQNKDSD